MNDDRLAAPAVHPTPLLWYAWHKLGALARVGDLKRESLDDSYTRARCKSSRFRRFENTRGGYGVDSKGETAIRSGIWVEHSIVDRNVPTHVRL